MGKEIENKTRGFTIEQNVLHNAAISDADVVPICKSIPEGDASNMRHGDRIKPRSLVVSGCIGLNPDYNPNNKPMIVQVMILAAKDKKTNSLIDPAGGGSAGLADLLKPNIGGTEQVPWDGTTFRSNFPINKEKFRVYYAKQFKLCPGSLAGGTREFDFVKWGYTFDSSNLPASLTFDEGNGDDANNFAPFLVIGWCYTDGTAGTGDLQSRLVSNTFSQLSYEDA